MGAGVDFARVFTAVEVMKGRSNRRKNTQANATDSGVVISTEIVRMCSFETKPVPVHKYEGMSQVKSVRDQSDWCEC